MNVAGVLADVAPPVPDGGHAVAVAVGVVAVILAGALLLLGRRSAYRPLFGLAAVVVVGVAVIVAFATWDSGTSHRHHHVFPPAATTP